MDERNKNIYKRKPPVLWKPKEDSGKNMKTFMKKLEKKYSVKMDNFWDCHSWSLENIDKFWAEIWEDSGIIYSKSYDKVVDLMLPLHEIQDWFSGARLNYAENLLKYRDNRIALIAAGEEKEIKEITFAEVYEESKLYAAALKKHGVKKGDKVACVMSNREEAVFAMLGTTSLGAIWLGALPLMDSEVVLNRFKIAHPKILFTVDRFQHVGEEKDMLPKLKDISENLPSLEKVVIVASKPDSKAKDITLIRNSCFLDEFLENVKNADGSVPEMVFEQVSFDYPVFLNYTSGTTGMPKALYHGCTLALTVYRDFQLSNHSGRSTCWLSVSPVGWTSWNILASMLFLGHTVILFDGDPFFLSPTYLWDMVDELKISNMLIGTSVLDELQRKNYLPLDRHHLCSLRFVMCGGSVIKPQNYEFFYNKIKKDCLFTSAYGSTETSGPQFLSNELLELHLAEIPGPLLGTAFEVLDESGKVTFGEVGDLVTTKPIPNMQRIWGDTDGSIFKNTYFEKYPDKFFVGDLAIVNPVTKGIIIYGRSDDTLKPRGCRFGTSEIYNIVNAFPEVGDSICVSHYNRKRDERAVLFLKMKPGYKFNQHILGRIRSAIAKELSDKHVPEVILETQEVPYNLNSKKMEIIVKRIINNMPYNPVTVINPECLDYYKNLPELGDFD